MMFGMMPPALFMMIRITIIVTITITSRVTHHIVALRLLLLLTRLVTMLRKSAAIARDTHDIVDTHTTGKEGHRQKETYNEHGDHHEYPRNRFQISKAERLERTGTYNTDEKPPEGSLIAACQQVVDNTSNG